MEAWLTRPPPEIEHRLDVGSAVETQPTQPAPSQARAPTWANVLATHAGCGRAHQCEGCTGCVVCDDDMSDECEFGSANASATAPKPLPPSTPRRPTLVSVVPVSGGYSAQIRTADGVVDPETRVSKLRQRYRQYPFLVQQLDAEVERLKALSAERRTLANTTARAKARAANPLRRRREQDADNTARAKAREDKAKLERDRATDAASKRQQRLANRQDKTADDLLFDLHESGAAFHTANSRHLRYFEPGSEEHKQISSDVAEDLDRFARVELTDKAECVRNYMDRAQIQMKVCGACSLRDPEAKYKPSRRFAACRLTTGCASPRRPWRASTQCRPSSFASGAATAVSSPSACAAATCSTCTR